MPNRTTLIQLDKRGFGAIFDDYIKVVSQDLHYLGDEYEEAIRRAEASLERRRVREPKLGGCWQ